MNEKLEITLELDKNLITDVIKEQGYEVADEKIDDCLNYLKFCLEDKYNNTTSMWDIKYELEEAITESDLLNKYKKTK